MLPFINSTNVELPGQLQQLRHPYNPIHCEEVEVYVSHPISICYNLTVYAMYLNFVQLLFFSLHGFQ